MQSVRRRRRGLRRSISTAVDTLLNNIPEASVIGIWSTEGNVQNSGGFVDSWDDIRGAAYGPSLVNTLTARPAWDGAGKLITFDGVNDYLRCVIAPTFIDNTILVVGVVPLPTTATVYAMTSIGATASSNQIDWINTPSIRAVSSGPFAVFPAPGAGRKAIIGRLAKVAGNSTMGITVGNNAEVTSTGAGGGPVADTLTVGASRVTAAFGAFACKAIVLLREGSGNYNQFLKDYATFHGAI